MEARRPVVTPRPARAGAAAAGEAWGAGRQGLGRDGAAGADKEVPPPVTRDSSAASRVVKLGPAYQAAGGADRARPWRRADGARAWAARRGADDTTGVRHVVRVSPRGRGAGDVSG